MTFGLFIGVCLSICQWRCVPGLPLLLWPATTTRRSLLASRRHLQQELTTFGPINPPSVLAQGWAFKELQSIALLRIPCACPACLATGGGATFSGYDTAGVESLLQKLGWILPCLNVNRYIQILHALGAWERHKKIRAKETWARHTALPRQRQKLMDLPWDNAKPARSIPCKISVRPSHNMRNFSAPNS